MINFCTLFDSNYLHFGLTLHESLMQNCPKFHLYVFAFDKKCEDFLRQKNLPNVTVISLQEFEDEKLLAVKPSRNKGEYCWTSTPSTIRYVLKNFKVEHCVYVDADLCFFGNPQILLDEMGDKSVLVTPHNYADGYDQSAVCGKYCVQFMFFRNNAQGLEVLEWWRERCLEWCFENPVDGKFGDQKYLDDWLVRFPQTHELRHEGGGVAPWNVSQYKIKDNKIYKKDGAVFDLIFYHFHGFALLDEARVKLTPKKYLIKRDAVKNIYEKYLQQMKKNINEVAAVSGLVAAAKAKKVKWGKKLLLKILPKMNNVILNNGLFN